MIQLKLKIFSPVEIPYENVSERRLRPSLFDISHTHHGNDFQSVEEKKSRVKTQIKITEL